MPFELCRHIKASGQRCHAPCISDQFWCFFHARLHFRHRAIRSAPKPKDAPRPLLLPVIEDRESIQVAASVIVAALAAGQLDEKRAGIMLRGLQIACRNLGGLLLNPSRDGVRSYLPTLDGIELAPRRMSDDSAPPKFEPRDPQTV